MRWLVLVLVGCAPAPSPVVVTPIEPPKSPTVVVIDAGVDAAKAPAPSVQATPDAEPGYPVIAEGTGVRKPPTLTSKCVDVLVDVKKRMNGVPLFQKPKRVDLDKDGKLDWIITSDAQASAYLGYMYIARGACGHFAGEWEGSEPDAIATWANGVSDLEAGQPCKVMCCPARSVSTYRFDGAEYQKIAERTKTTDCSHDGLIDSP